MGNILKKFTTQLVRFFRLSLSWTSKTLLLLCFFSLIVTGTTQTLNHNQIATQDGEDFSPPLPAPLEEVHETTFEERGHNHIIVKRQAVRGQNDYERFYLCLFSLFTNPNCRTQADGNYSPPGGQINQGQRDDLNGNTAFVSLLPQQQQQRPPGLFGNGIFGGRFGLNPQNSFNNNYNPYNPYGQQFFSPSLIPQTPYPEQQVHRRPGPGPTTMSITTPTPTTTKYTTTPTTTTTTTRRSTTPYTRRTTPATPTWTTSTPFHIFQTVQTFPVKEEGVECNTTKARFPERVTSPSTTPRPSTWSTPVLCPEIGTLKTLAKENTALKSELESSTNEMKTYQTQNKYLQEALVTLQGENSKLKSRVSQLERSNDDLQQKNGQLQHSVGDQKTQINEWRSKVKYLEEKMVRLSRQGIEDQKQVSRLQKRVRELGQQNVEFKSQIYQLQLRNTQRLVQETATSMEMEMHGHRIDKPRYPSQVYRDDISSSTEQFTHQQSVEYDVVTETTQTASPNEEGTTIFQEEIATEIVPLMDEAEITTLAPVIYSSTTTTPKNETSPPQTTTIKTTTSTPPSSSSETYESIFPLLNSETFAHHPGIIFDDNADPFGESGGVLSPVGGEEDDSNEFAILFGDPSDPDRGFNFGNPPQFYSPAHINAFNTHPNNEDNNGDSIISPYPYWNFPFSALSHNTNNNKDRVHPSSQSFYRGVYT